MTHNCTNTRLRGENESAGRITLGCPLKLSQVMRNRPHRRFTAHVTPACLFRCRGMCPEILATITCWLRRSVYVVQGQGVISEGRGQRWKNWDERIRDDGGGGMLVLPKNTGRDFKAAQWIWKNRYLYLIRLYLHFLFPRLKVCESFERLLG